MQFCSKCGNKNLLDAAFCANCGVPITTLKSGSPQTPSFKEATNEATEQLSDGWKKKFILIEKAGGVKMPEINKLTFGEKMKITFNFLGFLLGPIYYLFKGMWKKSISMTVGVIGFAVLVELLFGNNKIVNMSLSMIGPVIFATRANIDYYKKTVVKTDTWI